MEFFMITPHAKDPAFQQKMGLVKAIARRYGMQPLYAASKLPERTFDMEGTMAVFQRGAFFIADLSLERPSCYFEVGFAQASGKHVHLMAATGTDIHQVFHRESVRYYSSLAQYEELIALFLEYHHGQL